MEGVHCSVLALFVKQEAVWAAIHCSRARARMGVFSFSLQSSLLSIFLQRSCLTSLLWRELEEKH